jgi:hypothetical protein
MKSRIYRILPCNKVPAEYAPSEDGALLENAICVERQEKTA